MTEQSAATWAARKARAIAFLKDRPRPGKPWSSKRYDYQVTIAANDAAGVVAAACWQGLAAVEEARGR